MTEKTTIVSEDPILTFLALFNQIDKYFDKVLGREKFLPYNEKVKEIAKGNYTISWFVKLHQYTLRYFGEVRNQISHGIKLDGHTYIIPTPYAIQQLSNYASAIETPPRCGEVFKKDVYIAFADEKLGDIIDEIKENKPSHIPIYTRENDFLGIIAIKDLFVWIVDNFSDKQERENIAMQDCPLHTDNAHVIFVHPDKSVYEIDQLFTTRKLSGESTGSILITKHGRKNEPLIGIITSSDSALIDSFVMH